MSQKLKCPICPFKLDFKMGVLICIDCFNNHNKTVRLVYDKEAYDAVLEGNVEETTIQNGQDSEGA